MTTNVESSYSRRAAEYTKTFGSMSSVHPSDLQLVTAWAEQVDGPLLDAGCGPGQWTGYLAYQGHDARGIDQVPSFIDHARRTYPGVPFELGNVNELAISSGSVGGVLAWYALIHHEPGAIETPLAEIARVVRPGGGLLLGFFTGSELEAFDHAVVPAFRWPPQTLADAVRRSGFEVIETHTRTGSQPTPRPHGAMLARRC